MKQGLLQQNPINVLLLLLAIALTGGSASAEHAKGTESAPAAPQAIRFVTSPPAPEVKTTMDEASLVQDIVLETDTGLKGVHVDVTSLTGPEIVPLTCSIDATPCSTPFDLPGPGARTVHLTATLNTSGTYHAVVSLAGTQLRRSMTLTVVRTETPFSLEPAARVETAATSNGKFSLRVTVQEKRGKDAQLNVPTLILARRDAGKAALYSAEFTVTPRTNEGVLTGPWTIHKAEPKTINLDITGLENSGEYVGNVRFTSPSTLQRLDVPVLITVKDGPFEASLFIFAGVLLSSLLGLYVRSIRPRLGLQQQANQLQSDLDTLRIELRSVFGTLQDTEREVVDNLAQRLQQLSSRIESGTVSGIDATLQEIDLKLSLVRRWINSRRQGQSLAELPAELAAQLDSIAGFLLSTGMEQASAMQTQLTAVEEGIRKAWYAERLQRLNALVEMVKGSELPNSEQSALLRLADTAKAETEPSRQTRALEDAEEAVAAALAKDFADRLVAVTAPPLGFEPAAWSALKANIRLQLTSIGALAPGKRVSAYNAAVRLYLQEALEALEKLAKSRLSFIQRHPQLSEDQKKGFLHSLEDLVTRLESQKATLSGADLHSANRLIAEAEHTLTSMRDTLGQAQIGGFLGAAAEGAAAAAAPEALGIDFGTAFIGLLSGVALRGQRLANLSSNRLARLMQILDLLAFAVALVISILLGLKLLWADNATWGSWNDCTVALLWGLGLHQISNTFFQGVGATLSSIAK